MLRVLLLLMLLIPWGRCNNNDVKRVNYVTVWPFSQIDGAEFQSHTARLRTYAQSSLQTLVVPADVVDTLTIQLGDSGIDIVSDVALMSTTTSDIYMDTVKKLYDRLGTNSGDRYFTIKKDLLKVAYMINMKPGSDPTVLHDIEQHWGLFDDDDDDFRRIDKFKKNPDYDPNFPEDEFLRVDTNQPIEGMNDPHFALYGTDGDGTRKLLDQSSTSEFETYNVMDKYLPRFDSSIVYMPTGVAAIPYVQQSIVGIRTMTEQCRFAQDNLLSTAKGGTTVSTHDLFDVLDWKVTTTGPEPTFTNTITGKSGMMIPDVELLLSQVVLTDPIASVLQTQFDNSFVRPVAQHANPVDYIQVDHFSSVGDVYVTGQMSGIKSFLHRFGFPANQFSIPLANQVALEIQMPALIMPIDHICEDSGYDTPDDRRRRRAVTALATKKKSTLSCLLDPDQYNDDNNKFKKRGYDFKYDPETRSVNVFTDSKPKGIKFIVTHPRVVARVFRQHAQNVDRMFRKVFAKKNKRVVRRFIRTNRPTLNKMTSFRAMRRSLIKLTKSNTKTKHSKSKMSMLAAVSTVIIGSNDASVANLSTVDQMFASTDLMQSSAELISFIIPKKYPIYYSIASKVTKTLDRFNSVGVVVNLVNMIRKTVDLGGLQSFENGYWFFRTVTNTLSLMSKSIGRMLIPMVAFDMSLILKGATDNGRAALHETWSWTHLSPDQRTEVYMAGFLGKQDKVLSSYRKYAVVRSAIETSIQMAEELMTKMPDTRVVVIPYRQGMRLNNKINRVASGERFYGLMGHKCDYRDVTTAYTVDFQLKAAAAVLRRNYTTIDYNATLPSRKAFRGDRLAYNECISIARRMCKRRSNGGSNNIFSTYLDDNPTMLSQSLSRCPITDKNMKVVLRPANDVVRNYCTLQDQLLAEYDKRWDFVFVDKLHAGYESNTLMRPVLTSDQASSLSLIEYPYGSLSETKSAPRQVDFPRSCSSEGTTRYVQSVVNKFKSPKDLIVVHNDHIDKRRSKIVFYPSPREAVLPDNSVAYLYYSRSSIAAGNNSLIIASSVEYTRDTRLTATADRTGGLILSVTTPHPKYKLVINTDFFTTENAPPGLFLNNTNLTVLYLELLSTPHLSADWLWAVHAKNIDGGLMFIGPMTSYVSIGDGWTVVTYGDFANVKIESGCNLILHQTSLLSNVNVKSTTCQGTGGQKKRRKQKKSRVRRHVETDEELFEIFKSWYIPITTLPPLDELGGANVFP